MSRGLLLQLLTAAVLLVAIWLVTRGGADLDSAEEVPRSAGNEEPAPAMLKGSGETEEPQGDAVVAEAPLSEAPETTASPRAEESAPTDTASLTVRVVDGQGRPRSGLRIRLYVQKGETWEFTHDVRLDATGEVHFDDAHPDVVYLWIDVDRAHRSKRLELSAETPTEVEVTVPVGGTVTGTARHREKGVLAHVNVVIEHKGTDVRATYRTRTDAQGRFRLEGVVPGTHGVGVYGAPIDYNRRARAHVVVQDGEAVHTDIVLGTLSLFGRVRDAVTGKPVPEVRVSVASLYLPTSTDASGTFRIHDLPPGTYFLGFRRDGYRSSNFQDVEVVSGAVAEVEIELHRAGLLVLKLVTPEGRAVTGSVEIQATPVAGKGESARTSARTDGFGVVRWEQVLPGTYTVTAQIEGYRVAPIQVEVGASDDPIAIACVPLPREGVPVLRGIVRDGRTREPIPGVQIRHQRGRFDPVVTGETGAYALWRYLGSPLRLIVAKDGYGIRFIRGVKVEEGKETVLDIELMPAAQLHLWLTDVRGDPVVGSVTLAIHPKQQDKGWTSVGTSVRADAEGHAVYEEIVPGEYELAVIDEKAGRGEVDAVIQPGATVVRIQLGL